MANIKICKPKYFYRTERRCRRYTKQIMMLHFLRLPVEKESIMIYSYIKNKKGDRHDLFI